VQLARKTGRTSAAVFLEDLIAAVPYKIHMFDVRCREKGIEHRLTKVRHPWANGRLDRMNRTIKEATVQSHHYDRQDKLEAHLADFLNPSNYARRLKTLKGFAPYEYVCKCRDYRCVGRCARIRTAGAQEFGLIVTTAPSLRGRRRSQSEWLSARPPDILAAMPQLECSK
jgi:transposase InsO family protein